MAPANPTLSVQQLQFVLLGALATDDQDFPNSPGLNEFIQLALSVLLTNVM